jgi:hypothetical protein
MGMYHEISFPSPLRVSGKMNFNFGPSATLFSKSGVKIYILIQGGIEADEICIVKPNLIRT